MRRTGPFVGGVLSLAIPVIPVVTQVVDPRQPLAVRLMRGVCRTAEPERAPRSLRILRAGLFVGGVLSLAILVRPVVAQSVEPRRPLAV